MSYWLHISMLVATAQKNKQRMQFYFGDDQYTCVSCRDVVTILNVSVSRRSRDVFWNVSGSSRSRLGLENIMSRSRSCDLGLVNIHAMHQACGYIREKIWL